MVTHRITYYTYISIGGALHTGSRNENKCKWPFPLDIMLYNDSERHCIQYGCEGKCYKQVCSNANIKCIFPSCYAHFGTFSVITLLFELLTSSLVADHQKMVYSFIPN